MSGPSVLRILKQALGAKTAEIEPSYTIECLFQNYLIASLTSVMVYRDCPISKKPSIPSELHLRGKCSKGTQPGCLTTRWPTEKDHSHVCLSVFPKPNRHIEQFAHLVQERIHGARQDNNFISGSPCWTTVSDNNKSSKYMISVHELQHYNPRMRCCCCIAQTRIRHAEKCKSLHTY